MGEAKSRNLLGLTTRWVSRILAAAVGLLLPVLPAEVHAVETPAAGATYAYDGHDHSALPTYTPRERRPPGTDDHASAYDAVGRWWSHGASARPEAATTTLAYTYNDPTQLVRLAGLASTAQRPAEGTPAEPSSLERSQVAANGAQKWAYRRVGRDHPGYDDALKGRVNPRNPNGTATPEQHNLGNTTDSPFTSWTRDPDIARRFAGPDGVVLRVPRGEGSPYKFEWSPDVYYEQEILIRGPVCGALIC